MNVDLRICDLCAEVYPRNDYTWGNGEIRVFSFYEDGFLKIIGAGSRTPEDWWRDAQAVEMLAVPGVGMAARSFWEDTLAVLDQIATVINHASLPFVLGGHSKGGGEMLCLAAQLKLRGLKASRLTTFEAPPVGLFGELLDDIEGPDFAHHGDPVPQLPPERPHPRPLIWFSDAALPIIPDPFANHHLTVIRPALVAYQAAHPGT